MLSRGKNTKSVEKMRDCADLSTSQVISASRRTDIPAFYSEWFMRRIREGFARYRNPFGGQIYEVSLRPDDVMAFVFWSRNYAPLRPYLPELDACGYGAYFHGTLNDYGLPFEPNAPPTARVIESFHALAQRYSPRHLIWRFDPILLSNATPAGMLVEKFGGLAERLRGATLRCVISFADFYRKVRGNLERLTKEGVRCEEPTLEGQIALVRQLVGIAGQYNIRLAACCESGLLAIDGVQQAHCIDSRLLADLFPAKFHQLAPAPTRDGCGCFASRDIGAYDTCVHGCVYCYANSSPAKAMARFQAHDPQQPCL